MKMDQRIGGKKRLNPVKTVLKARKKKERAEELLKMKGEEPSFTASELRRMDEHFAFMKGTKTKCWQGAE